MANSTSGVLVQGSAFLQFFLWFLILTCELLVVHSEGFKQITQVLVLYDSHAFEVVED